ncbi:MAG: hypothetical protein ATN35_11585 [Epulopiscium sp. Nele67-Bin004]|nr:MAG: hypothetical protein ATN35_11585 [Epulopiscium sp. Nele67-Bin004]
MDFNKLRTLSKDTTNENMKVSQSTDMLNEFTQLITFLVEDFRKLSVKESALFIMSLVNWFKRKDNSCYKDKKTGKSIKPKVGEIYLADLGIAYKPEMGYTHPVIIIGIVGNSLLVVPTTTSKEKLQQAYHPISNPEGKRYLRKVDKIDGFATTCTILLRKGNTISIGRLLEYKGKVKDENLINEVVNKSFEQMYPRIYRKQQGIEIENIELNAKINILQEEIEVLKKN